MYYEPFYTNFMNMIIQKKIYFNYGWFKLIVFFGRLKRLFFFNVYKNNIISLILSEFFALCNLNLQ